MLSWSLRHLIFYFVDWDSSYLKVMVKDLSLEGMLLDIWDRIVFGVLSTREMSKLF